jgi:hypothetical protein
VRIPDHPLPLQGGAVPDQSSLPHSLIAVLAESSPPGAGAHHALRRPDKREKIVLLLALVSVALGLLPLAAFGLVQVGRLDLAP